MKYLYLFFFIILISCGTSKKTYICGDRACLNKKEFKKYFAKNLIVEVKVKKAKKKNSINLVNLNTAYIKKTQSSDGLKAKSEKLNKKEQKALFKANKSRLKQERKRKKIEEKLKIREEKKITKIKKKNEESKKINFLANKMPEKKKPVNAVKEIIKNKTALKIDKVNKINSFKSIKSENQVDICNGIKNCDIDKIAELLIKKGKNKDFPDITSR